MTPLSPVSHTPQSLSQGFYGGWGMVLVAAVAMAATLPGRTHGLGLITKPLLAEFKTVTEQDYGRINLVATLIGSLFCLPCGWLIDRVGIRHLLGITLLTLAAVVWGLAQVQTVAGLVVAITLTRGVGQSMLSVLSITVVGRWFRRRLNWAMGLYAVTLTMLMAVATGVVGSRAQTFGWRPTWEEVSLTLAGTGVLAWLFARDRPLADNREFLNSDETSAKDFANIPDSGATLMEALRSPCFWAFALGTSFFGMVSAGLTLFQQLILEERGLGSKIFLKVMIIGLLAGLLANILVGALARTAHLGRWLAAGLLLQAISLMFLRQVHTVPEAFGYGLLQGLSGGAITVTFFAIWGQAFGTKQLGRIQGAAQMLTVLASAVGPLFVAESHGSQGDYQTILLWFALIAIALAVFAWIVSIPRHAAKP